MTTMKVHPPRLLPPLLALLLLLGLLPVNGRAQADTVPFSFQAGEVLQYKIWYNWKALWVSAGEVTFTVDTATIFNRNCFKFTGIGSTYKRYDLFYKVRDRYESYSDPVSYRPYRFLRKVHEGGTRFYEEYVVNHKKNRAYRLYKPEKKSLQRDTLSIPPDAIDALTMIYYARNMDFSARATNDTVPITLLLDNKVHHTYFRYLGTDTFESNVLGNVECIKFRPLLVEGSMFQGGEHMIVWVTNDQNRIPVYIESKIAVGWIKSKLIGFEGLRYPVAKK